MLSSPYTRVSRKEERSKLLNVGYTQHEFIYREDVKLPWHIGNYQQILKEIF